MNTNMCIYVCILIGGPTLSSGPALFLAPGWAPGQVGPGLSRTWAGWDPGRDPGRVGPGPGPGPGGAQAGNRAGNRKK